MSDPLFDATRLLLDFNGSNISTDLVDRARMGSPSQIVGGVSLSATAAKNGLAGLLCNGGRLQYDNSGIGKFGTSDFTLEVWLQLIAGGKFGSDQWGRIAESVTFGTAGGWQLVCPVNANPSKIRFHNSSVDTAILETPTAVANATWMHLAVARQAGVFRMFVDGTKVSEATASHNFTAQGFCIAGNHVGGERFNGYMDDFRVTHNVARYWADFTPPSAEFFFRTLSSQVRQEARGAFNIDPGALAPGLRPIQTRLFNLRGARSLLLASTGGDGIISGIVTVENVPAARQVRLFDKLSGLPVAETVSSVTGSYAFTGLAAQREYFVVAHDNARVHNAVVQDMLTP